MVQPCWDGTGWNISNLIGKEDLFASLVREKKFTKLDLPQAYQQSSLDKECRKYVTINTHKGLYQYTRLLFGIASAPAMFQKPQTLFCSESLLLSVTLHDILVTGANDQEHLHNLSAVLDRLQKHGNRMKRDKCSFSSESVEYLGHIIDAQGLHPTTGEVDAIVQAPDPKNVQELRLFLGLINYYGTNFATMLHPLNSLLQKGKKWEWTLLECNKALA